MKTIDQYIAEFSKYFRKNYPKYALKDPSFFAREYILSKSGRLEALSFSAGDIDHFLEEIKIKRNTDEQPLQIALKVILDFLKEYANSENIAVNPIPRVESFTQVSHGLKYKKNNDTSTADFASAYSLNIF